MHSLHKNPVEIGIELPCMSVLTRHSALWSESTREPQVGAACAGHGLEPWFQAPGGQGYSSEGSRAQEPLSFSFCVGIY